MLTNPPVIQIQDEGTTLGLVRIVNVVGRPTRVTLPTAYKAQLTIDPLVTAFVGGITTVGGTAVKQLFWGTVADDMEMPYAGRVIAVSVKMSTARTAGTLTVQLRLNGSAGSTILTIDATNTTKIYSVLGTPLDFVAGDLLGAQTTTASFTPTSSDATIVLVCEIYP